jgi:N-acetylglucosamine kinase-like BadF-type ATPase
MKLIVDSGSTKADWVLIQADGSRLDFASAGINSMTQSSDTILSIISGIHHLLAVSNQVHEVFFYGAGCSKGETREIVEAVLASVFSNAVVKVDTDLMACALATYNNEPMISCILGTGSNACYFDGNSIKQKIPALGYVLGDEGGGSYFGKQLLKAYFYETLPEDLRVQFDKTYSLQIQELLKNVYREPSANRYLASFTQFIGDHKMHPYIKDIVATGLQIFLKNFVCCYNNATQVQINFVGSVAYCFQDELRNAGKEIGLSIGSIFQKPIEGLVAFHCK